MEHTLTADLRFSIIPEWVLDAPISDRAHRVYALLARYADNETLQAFPSRETLAKRAHCNTKAITKAINELVEIGAVVKQHRRNGESYQSNVYTLRRVGPFSTPRVNSDPGVGSNLTPPRVSDDPLTITTELEPDNYINSSFLEFWNIYPKKTDKRAALKAFKAAMKRADKETILAGARTYAADRNRDIRFTKNPATWLNADAWENEPLPTVTGGTKPPAEGPGKGDWIRQLHDIGEHFACDHD